MLIQFPGSLLSSPDVNQTGVAHTPWHVNCPACAGLRSVRAYPLEGQMSFADSAKVWRKSMSECVKGEVLFGRPIRERTRGSYEQYLDSLELFFSVLRLNEIHIGHIRAYQVARVAGAAPFIRKRRPHDEAEKSCPASPKKTNQELGLLRKVLRRAKCWTSELQELYQPLPEHDADVPRAQTPEEQAHWLRVASSEERWLLVYWYCQLAYATTMSPHELRALHMVDINVRQRTVSVPREGAKNIYRQRTLALVEPEAVWSAEQLLRRARDLGALTPFHYLFPFGLGNGEYDATRPMTVSGLKRSWNEVREATGILWFRPADTRHTAITRMAERGVNIATIQSYAGHMNLRTTRHYTHIIEAAQRKELERHRSRRKPPRSVSMPAYVPRDAVNHS